VILRKLSLVGLVAVFLIGAALPAGAASEPSVSVVPGTDLQDGDLVDVIGSGFTGGTTVYVMLCNDDEALGDTIDRCALIGAGALGYFIDATGRFVASDVPVPVGQVGASGMATCPPSAAQIDRGVGCSIEVASTDLVEVAGEVITYVEGVTVTNENVVNVGSGSANAGPGSTPNKASAVVSGGQLAYTGAREMWLLVIAAGLITVGGLASAGAGLVEKRVFRR